MTIPLDIALFDLYTEGHHIPYARTLKSAIDEASDHRTTFVTLTETDRCRRRFDQDEVVYLAGRDSTPIEDRNGNFVDIADEIVSELASKSAEYDVIHFLYADDILGSIWRHCSTNTGPAVVGELNGMFFHRGTVLRNPRVHPLFLRLLRSPFGSLVDSLVPERSSHESLWRDLYLYRSLADATFDHVAVHTEEAASYVAGLTERETTPVSVVPYPAPAEFGTDISKREAREHLGLPHDASILLFFGVLRNERGVDILLDAVRRYRGPEFTLLIAGPPVATDEAEIRSVDEASPVEIVPDLGYVDDPEVYYRASDAVVFPYKRKSGKEKQSQMFQEVCSSLRPVIVPDFGVLGRCVNEWDLGVTYRPESTDSLQVRLREFAAEGIPFSEERMAEYTRRHSYERIASDLIDIYETEGAPRTARITPRSSTNRRSMEER